MRKEIIFIGRGGQGIVLMGKIFTKAVFLQGLEVAYTASYGAATRGERCTSEVVISKEPIDFPGVMTPDILVVMSQEGYDDWITKISPKAKIFFDIDTVKTILPVKARHIPVAALQIATQLGSPLSANMVMLGFLAVITRIISLGNLSKAIEEGTGELSVANLEAMIKGCEQGVKFLLNQKLNQKR